MGVVMPIRAVCSTKRSGAIVSLKSSGGILAASSKMRHWPPVPFVPYNKGRSHTYIATFRFHKYI
jgi:hypothetical protein